jgi:Peptidase M50B-like
LLPNNQNLDFFAKTMPQDSNQAQGSSSWTWGGGFGSSNNNNNNNNNNWGSYYTNEETDLAWSCCNDSQTLFLLLYLAFVCLALITWNTLIAKPMRLIAVFIHEWSHATACWLTGGSVVNIEVHDNEGGVTRFIGGCRSLIIPAGYVGCGFWAMIFVIMSGGRKTATAAAIVFSMSLVVALCYNPNRVLVYLCLAYMLLTIGVTVIEYRVYSPLLQFLILFYGVFVGIYAIEDIYQDTVKREVRGSDAYACHQEVCPFCLPRCVGLQWAILAIAFQLCGIWIAIVQMSEECEDLGWFKCMTLGADFDPSNNWDWEGFFHQEDIHFYWNGGNGPGR